MPRTGAILAMLVVVLVAGGCGGDEERAPADLVEDAGPDGAVSEVDPKAAASSEAPVASEAEPSEGTVADTTPRAAGERFADSAPVQTAVTDAQEEDCSSRGRGCGHEAAVRDLCQAATR